VITYLGLLYFWVLKPYLGGLVFRALYKPLGLGPHIFDDISEEFTNFVLGAKFQKVLFF
jgi:hypothetical protein